MTIFTKTITSESLNCFYFFYFFFLLVNFLSIPFVIYRRLTTKIVALFFVNDLLIIC
jgi:hypothetical protein